MKYLKKIIKTNNDWVGLITRLTIGGVLFPHGAQKMLGIFGGYGFTGTIDFFTQQINLPWIVAFSVIVIEFIGAISMIIGFASRIWALAIAFLFVGIIFTTNLEHGFFMNWFGTQNGEGYEYSLLMIGLSLATLVNGSGKYSIDNVIAKKVLI